ncbi:hypothetical protein EVAR_94199_1 [Eumeta japonica]|uniref:Uncharacterized protein n=1 Tax=Eumeta variegata TaxID=151549 RepID=A0A4C1UN05_EUMVA|nr:hypothetical protein EVAR_94199_1 [Eumeta japonica]
MVSIVLLTTEEVLSRNSYWCRLDTLWVTVDLEPFEDVEPEHLFTKPLSRDAYYARYPEIERSESEEETSMTVAGFRNKYDQWRSKIMIRRIIKQQDRSKKSKFSNRSPRSSTSLLSDLSKSSSNEIIKANADRNSNDQRIEAFLTRLLENIPPPPISEVNDKVPEIHENNEMSVFIVQKIDNNFNDVEIPDYDEFVNHKALINDEAAQRCSTLKKEMHRGKNIEFLCSESWNDTIYGLPDLQLPGPIKQLIRSNNSLSMLSFDNNRNTNDLDFDDYFEENLTNEYEYTESWSDVINIQHCSEDDSIVEPNFLYKCASQEEIVSRSHCNDLNIFDISDSDDERDYAKFAIYKIYKSTNQENGMMDSSSMMNLYCEDINNTDLKSNPSLFYDIYRLAPIDNSTSDPKMDIS